MFSINKGKKGYFSIVSFLERSFINNGKKGYFSTVRQTEIRPRNHKGWMFFVSWASKILPDNFWSNFTSKSSSSPKLQPYQPITVCVNPTLTTRGVTTLAFIAHASRTTRPTCSAATTTTLHSNTAATKRSSRWSCSSTSPPPQMDMHTSELKPNHTAIWPCLTPLCYHSLYKQGYSVHCQLFNEKVFNLMTELECQCKIASCITVSTITM